MYVGPTVPGPHPGGGGQREPEGRGPSTQIRATPGLAQAVLEQLEPRTEGKSLGNKTEGSEEPGSS